MRRSAPPILDFAINPNFAQLSVVRGAAESYLGRCDQSEADVQQAMRLSPRDPLMMFWHLQLAVAEFCLGHLDAAIDASYKAIEAGNRTFVPHLFLAADYALEGKMDEAKPALAEALRLNPKLTVKSVRPDASACPECLTKYIEGLRKAGLPEEWARALHLPS